MSEETVDIEALKSSRSSYAGVVTRSLRRYQRMAEDDPATFDLDMLAERLTSLETTERRCHRAHETICEEETDPRKREKEEEAGDTFDDNVEATRSLLKRFIALKTAHELSTELHYHLDNLENSKARDPEKDHSAAMVRLTSTFETFQSILRKSTIHPGHVTRQSARDFDSRLTRLSVKEIPTPPPTIVTAVPAATTKTVQLPKISLPQFDGDLMGWSSFWSQFSAAVDANKQLTSLNKLAYLRDAIKDPTTRSLLFSGAENDGLYDEVVALLHERFDKRREVHANYCQSLISMGQVKTTKAELTQFADTLTTTISGLKHTGQYDIESVLTSLLVPSISKQLQVEWEVKSQHSRDVPPIEDFIKFIRFRASILNASTATKPPENKPEHPQHPKKYKATVNAAHQRSSNGPIQGFRYDCNLCNGEKHPLFQCPNFNSMNVSQRGEHIRSFKLCYNCLAPGHKTADCRSSARCRSCGGRHHTLVHRDQGATQPVNVATVNCQSLAAKPASPIPSFLTMTSQVLVKGPGGRQMVARALLDTGATMSMVSSRVARTLQLPPQGTRVTITGVKDMTDNDSHPLVKLSLCPVHTDKPILSMLAASVPKVAGDLPLQGAASVKELSHIKPLKLADPTFHLPGKIDVLLGSNVMQHILLTEARSGPNNEPQARETVFGWAILGQFTPNTDKSIISAHQSTVEESTDALLSKFWDVEENLSHVSLLTNEEEAVQTHFAANHVYVDPPGHYQVSLPRKPNSPALGSSRPQAVQRFLANERAVIRKGTWEAFQTVVKEYVDLGHAELVPAQALSPSVEQYYLPMHSVTKESSTSTKLRVVFDASAHTSTNQSLNDILMTGPTLYPNLDTILLRFRLHQVAISADISKMYRVVWLDPKDRDLHRFLWREQPTGPLIDYRMTRVTFGVSSSPYLAIRALQQTAADFGHMFPKASPLIYTSFYVDDLLTGADTPEQAIQLYTELRALLLKGGFDLCKWRSSSEATLKAIEPSLREKVPVKDLTDVKTAHPKALGVEWDSTQDTMATSLTLPDKYVSTKRGVISDVARTFDVLGWLGPTMIQMKILYQKLWELKLAWDDEIPPEYIAQHREWREQLPLLADKQHPRCYFAPDERRSVQLHGFSDASKYAYAAVVYIRTTYASQEPTCVLVTAKTRVAPLKGHSIPKLELCGARLLAQLMTNVREALNIPVTDMHAWCDSEIVLWWLDGKNRKLKPFEANRIASILSELPSYTWHHVPGLENPADCASRGILPSALRTHPLWWNGPPWLSQDPLVMPFQPFLVSSGTPESQVVCNLAIPVPPTLVQKDRYNSYHMLINVTAWVLRFVANLKLSRSNQPKRLVPYLTATETSHAEHFMFKQSQSLSFPNELYHLMHEEPIRSSSSLRALSPFIDKQGLIRVGGRLSKSHLSFSQVHPVILSSKGYVSQLMFNHKHVSLGHCGPSLVLSSTGSKVHVIGARRLSRSVCRSCVICRRANAQTEHQMMGQLPSARVTPSPPFSVCGVDYAGPFLIKKGHTRKPVIVKAYLAVFVCYSTKAAHLEVVSDATTEAFLGCLRRFVSRRGLPSDIHSNNGGNFRGARHDLQELYKFLETDSTNSDINSYLLAHRVQWHSTPERAPHFGGLWEAAVKSAKKHLKRIIGSQRLDFEEFATITAQVESCLNSRPLLSITSHSQDGITAITPGHFLIGRELCAYPETSIQADPSLFKRWTLCQAITQHFWRRWSSEYLQQLQKLQKWRKPSPNIRVGDIVIIRDDQAFTNHWPMAKVLETFPGQDGLVRVVSLKTSSGILKRPIAKLALLLHNDQTTIPKPPTVNDLQS